jgi:hypothetical protein
MMNLMPPQLTLWGSPLYGELCVGLCRALAGPWLGTHQPAKPGPAAAPAKRLKRPPERAGWQLLDSDQAAAGPIGASSLAELRRTVRDLREYDEAADAMLVGSLD